MQTQRASYCQVCFMAAFTFKTRKGLDPARQASRGGSQSWHTRYPATDRGLERDSLLLAFSGGPSSRALLDIIAFFFPRADDHTQTNAKFKPPPFFAGIEVVYVDQSELDGFGADRTDEVRAIVDATGFNFVSIKLSSLFEPGSSSLSLRPSTSALLAQPSTSTASPADQLRALLAPLPPTARASVTAALLSTALHRTAVARGHATLLTGETSTRLAIRTIAGMALGRGGSMGEEVGWEFESAAGVLQCRPLRGVVDAEVRYYNRTKGLDWLERARPSDGVEPKKAGIDAVSEDFINNLEATFASTVSTVLRTAHKLGLRTNHDRLQPTMSPAGATCPLCGLPSQLGAETWRSAITISSLIDGGPAERAEEGVAAGVEGGEARALAPLLCYGCLLNWQGAQQAAKRPAAAGASAADDPTVPLPAYVAEAAGRRWASAGEVVGERTIGVDQLRTEVEQFLL